jgi:hypothetical protein
MKQCVRELSKLYTRALRFQPKLVGIAAEWSNSDVLSACDRGFLLLEKPKAEAMPGTRKSSGSAMREIDISGGDGWESILQAVTSKQ